MSDRSLETRLRQNRRKREATESALDSLRAELADLLAEGRAAGVKVPFMTSAAGISRETAYKLLRRKDGR